MKRKIFPFYRSPAHAVLALMALAFAYTCVRACRIPLFHDEAFTYLVHARDTVANSLTLLGNNHLLNTLLIKGSAALLGVSEFTVRLPALLGHALYLSGSYATMHRFARRYFLRGLTLLVFNPFLLELFSAARGYALGLGFMAWSLYFLLKHVEGGRAGKSSRAQALSTGLAGMAALSQLVFVYPYAAVLTVVFVGDFFSLRREPQDCFWKRYFQSLSYPFAVTLALLLIYALPVRFMMAVGGFYHGGSTGFWQDTVRSLTESVLYGRAYPAAGLRSLGVMIAALTIAGPLALFMRGLKTTALKAAGRLFLAVSAVLGLAVFFIVASHYLFGVKFLIGRMAVFLLPLFLIYVIMACNFLARAETHLFLQLPGWFLAGLSVLNIIHLAVCANISLYTICPYDAQTRMAVEKVAAIYARKPRPEGLTLGINPFLGPSVSFYKFQKGLDWLKLEDITDLQRPPDYYYLISPESRTYRAYRLDKEFRTLRGQKLQVIKRFPLAGTFLAER